MAKKSPITFNSKNGKEIYERMVRVETKIDEIKELLKGMQEDMKEKEQRIEENTRFIEAQKVLNKIYFTLLIAIITSFIGFIIKSILG